MTLDALARAGALPDLLMLTACFGVLVFGVLIYRNPVLFWDQFNPYLKPYSRFTIAIGKLIGSLWAAGATLGCIALAGNAIRESLHHHWLR